jgi:hypothetical protein
VQRNELARERGFRNYYEQRRATQLANADELFTDSVGAVSRQEAESRSEYNEMVKNARAFYNAFGVKANEKDYSADSAKKVWFVDTVGSMTLAEWLKHYPNGVREYQRIGFGNAA